MLNRTGRRTQRQEWSGSRFVFIAPLVPGSVSKTDVGVTGAFHSPSFRESPR